MSDKRFVDTNVLVYAYDTDDRLKQARAQELLRAGLLNEDMVISVQVVGEFFATVTRRIQQPMSSREAKEAIDRIKVIPVVDIDLQLVERAIEIHLEYQISYWDALIVASAERSGCIEILSEDLNEGQRYAELVIVNPFKPDI